MAKNCKMTTHSFYCIKCGNQSIPLPRKDGFKHNKFHKKKLYCYKCKETINHVECTNKDEVEIFLERFKKGVYIDEVEESLAHVRSTGQWQDILG